MNFKLIFNEFWIQLEWISIWFGMNLKLIWNRFWAHLDWIKSFELIRNQNYLKLIQINRFSDWLFNIQIQIFCPKSNRLLNLKYQSILEFESWSRFLLTVRKKNIQIKKNNIWFLPCSEEIKLRRFLGSGRRPSLYTFQTD